MGSTRGDECTTPRAFSLYSPHTPIRGRIALMDRAQMLKEILVQDPDNSFARYGLAMEYSRDGEVAAALTEFNLLLEKNPAYFPGYQMAAQMLVSVERAEEARPYLERGISEAQRAGNQHAASEMTALLDDISR